MRGDGTFSFQKATVTRDSWPLQARASDINGDGSSDIVTLMFGSTVQLMSNQGDGSFRAKEFTIGSWPAGMAIADFNADGYVDVAAANRVAGTISLLLNVSGNEFSAPRAYEIGRDANAMALVDVTSDAIPDLLTPSLGTNAIFLRRGELDGSFGDLEMLSLNSPSAFFAVGDVNNDGHEDILATEYPWRLAVLLGIGDGRFTNAPSRFLNGNAVGLALADFDQDGNLDLATTLIPTNPAASLEASLWFGNGDGTFRDAIILDPPASGALATADFNKDTKPDLLVGTSVFLGIGSGMFTHVFELGQIASVRTADLNSDGIVDLILFDDRGFLTIRRGDGEGAFQPLTSYNFGSSIRDVAIADVNGDNHLDLVLDTPGFLSVALGNGDGTFATMRNYPAPRLSDHVVTGDVNRDGREDIIATGENTAVVYLNQTSVGISLARASAGVLLTWPSYTAGLLLESTESLAAPDWRRVPAPVSVLGDHYVVTNATTRPAQFFRLRRQ